jgi:6-phosphogluconolactonase
MTERSFDNAQAWLAALVEAWQSAGGQALRQRGEFIVALSGGSTPAAFYKELAKLDWPWSSTRLFIGDERWVPSDHEQSNHRMIYEAFYPKPLSLERWKTEMASPAEAAMDYEKRTLRVAGDPPRFDLVLLGIGSDGHTASLFPGTDALDEFVRYAIHNRVPQLETTRLTYTYALLAQARDIWFLAKGADKQPWIQKMAAGNDRSFPAARVEAPRGTVTIFNCQA